MPIVGTFNGASIVQMPASPVPQSVELGAQDTVAISTSPFTGQQQVQDWQASWLTGTITMPPLTNTQAQTWIAFLLQLRGQANVFQFGDPIARAPQGTGAGVPVVNGAGQSGYSLATRGWTANATGVLLAGDWLQIGYRLYRCLDATNADASGYASVPIWPQLRESPADGVALVLTQTKGLWRLGANLRKWSASNARIYGLTFEFREAL